MQTLAQYLAAQKITQAQFADRVGSTSATVSRWCSGKAFPNKDAVKRIDAATGGEVPPAVWYEAKGAAA